MNGTPVAPPGVPPTIAACWGRVCRLATLAIDALPPADRAWLDAEVKAGSKIGILAGDALLMVCLVSPDGTARPMAVAKIVDLLGEAGGAAN